MTDSAANGAAAAALLTALGSEASAVAATLRDGEYRGGRNSLGCPVALYLKAGLPGATVRVGFSVVRVLPYGGREGEVDVPLPNPVQEFIQNLHYGDYPDLEVDDG